MAHLLSCQSIGKRFGANQLFTDVTLAVSEGDRVGLIGPNGSGKSTLVQILAGEQDPDEGVVAYRKQLRLGYVAQEPRFEPGVTARAAVVQAICDQKLDDFERETKAAVTLGRLGFVDLETVAESLSGGWRKRLAIARELVREPEVLLLDEPTNHLDLDGILELERLLLNAPFASVVVTHDRYFLENVATDVVELNRAYPSGTFRAHGGYSEFLLKREEYLAAQSKQREALENKVRREVEWLRRGPKARTTKSKARIDEANRLIAELTDARSRSSERTVGVEFSGSGRQTKRLLAVKSLEKSLGGRALFTGLNVVLRPGDRLGLVGANGSGKTTLLRILAGELAPDGGSIDLADNLQTVYFQQHRDTLDPELPLRRALAPEGDSVIYGGRTIHVAGWAKRFLFRPEQLDLAVGKLSGGERARVAIARLMIQPADLLLLDEPTNDLDITTLEVLEDNLLDFAGALVLVTHDRYLLDRVSTAVLGLGPDNSWGYFADYSQWELARQQETGERSEKPKPATSAAEATKPSSTQKKKLSYLEAREWDTIETAIAEAEGRLHDLQHEMNEAAAASDPARLHEAYEHVQDAQARVDKLYERWAELEAKQT
jgi:ATP-binding cassette subfamily F protein uup